MRAAGSTSSTEDPARRTPVAPFASATLVALLLVSMGCASTVVPPDDGTRAAIDGAAAADIVPDDVPMPVDGAPDAPGCALPSGRFCSRGHYCRGDTNCSVCWCLTVGTHNACSDVMCPNNVSQTAPGPPPDGSPWYCDLDSVFGPVTHDVSPTMTWCTRYREVWGVPAPVGGPGTPVTCVRLEYCRPLPCDVGARGACPWDYVCSPTSSTCVPPG